MDESSRLTSMCHLVLGTGALARATGAALAAMKLHVRFVSRSGKLTDPPPGTEVVAADLADTARMASLLDNVAAIYQCAQPPYHRWAAEFPALQAAAVALAERADVRLVVGENLYGYGAVEAMREDTPLAPVSKKGAVRASMTRALLAARDAGRVKVAIARFSDFYGPNVTASMYGERFFPAIVSGKPVEVFGDADVLHTLTYIADAGQAMAALGTDAGGDGEVWHAPSNTVTLRRFVTKAAAAAGVTAQMKPGSVFGLRIAGLFVPGARETIEMLYMYQKPFVMDDTAMRTTFGLAPTPLEEAIAATINWYRARA